MENLQQVLASGQIPGKANGHPKKSATENGVEIEEEEEDQAAGGTDVPMAE